MMPAVSACACRLVGALLASADGGGMGLTSVRQLAAALADHALTELDAAHLTADSMVRACDAHVMGLVTMIQIVMMIVVAVFVLGMGACPRVCVRAVARGWGI